MNLCGKRTKYDNRQIMYMDNNDGRIPTLLSIYILTKINNYDKRKTYSNNNNWNK